LTIEGLRLSFKEERELVDNDLTGVMIGVEDDVFMIVFDNLRAFNT
jgi:hypothetical protein